jgi:hypothetical protein
MTRPFQRPDWRPIGVKPAKRVFEHIRTIVADLVFPDWRTLMTTLTGSRPPPGIEKQIAG